MSRLVRHALPTDLDALVALEDRAFSGDRFSRRQLWHLLNRANAHTLVVEAQGNLLGYGTLLMRRNSSLARLYSLCVAPEARGSGLGRELLARLESDSRALGLDRMALEVRADNRRAMRLYRQAGFRLVGWLDEYYEDGCAAWRMLKGLGAVPGGESSPGAREALRNEAPKAASCW